MVAIVLSSPRPLSSSGIAKRLRLDYGLVKRVVRELARWNILVRTPCLGNVCSKLLWRWDEPSGVLYFPTWWKYNPPEDANVLIGCLKDLDDLPNSPVVAKFCENVTYLDQGLHETFAK